MSRVRKCTWRFPWGVSSADPNDIRNEQGILVPSSGAVLMQQDWLYAADVHLGWSCSAYSQCYGIHSSPRVSAVETLHRPTHICYLCFLRHHLHQCVTSACSLPHNVWGLILWPSVLCPYSGLWCHHTAPSPTLCCCGALPLPRYQPNYACV